MKKLLMVAALSAAGLAGTGTQAATTNDTFDVDINLTAVCTVNVTTNVAFAYTSNQGGNQASTGGGVTVTCTNGVPYTFSLIHNITGLAPVFPVTDAAVNLDYSLTAPAGANGNGAAQAHAITGNMAGGQAGTCGGGICNNLAAGNKTYTLVVTY